MTGRLLVDLLQLYSDKEFRKQVTKGIRNDVVRTFWQDEFAHYPDRMRAEAVAPILNKIGALLTDPRLFNILVKPKVDISFRRLMDEGRVLVVNLAKGRLGEDGASVLGGLIVSTIGLAALSRADERVSARRPFFLYVDEFQSFTTLSFANMMAELRKYGVGLVLAHQHLHQLEPDIQHAVLAMRGRSYRFAWGRRMPPCLRPSFSQRLGCWTCCALRIGTSI